MRFVADDEGSSDPVGVRLNYQWYRSGVVILGATASTYVPVARDAAASLTLDDALGLWDYETQTEEEREEPIRAIQRGLDDMYAGRTRPVEEFHSELQQRHKLNPD